MLPIWSIDAKPLRDKPAPTVFTEADNGEADHLCAAAGGRRAACEACNADHGAQRRGADRKGEHHADHHRDDNAHDKRLHLRRGIDEAAQHVHQIGDDRAGELCDRHAGEDGHNGGDEDINLRRFGYELSQLHRDDRRNERTGGSRGQGELRTINQIGRAQAISGVADSRGGEEDQGRRF